MIFRAVFWIGMVALLLPREPDLGFGRPGGAALPPEQAAAALREGLAHPDSICGAGAPGCALGAGAVDLFRSLAIRNLDTIKTEIEASQRARAQRL
jgi:hypothetical protein